MRSTLSQQPEFQFDENLSQIPALDEGGQYSSQPSQHGEDGSRGKVSRLEAVQMMRKAAGLAEGCVTFGAGVRLAVRLRRAIGCVIGGAARKASALVA